ncbi:methyltransferase domain-containing protein, partial [Schlesneria sp.]|uniref:methyltransferase domain-containing protein n=1 Tax=Schlesneria sp. TaxID=2762018 RepID=UPI002F129DBB
MFETLACGPLLITNDLRSNGQDELFKADRHFVVYTERDELLDKLVFYLKHDKLREKIAISGYREVLSRHTYLHRMQQLLGSISSHLHTTLNVGREGINPAKAVPLAVTDASFISGSFEIDSVDFIIKTFLRPQALLRLLKSILCFYPGAHVTIVDDGCLQQSADLASGECRKLLEANPQFRMHSLPFAAGVTAGRNLLVDRTTRPFLLLLDDDFCFTDRTQVEKLLQRMQSEPDLGVVAGVCVDVIDGVRQPRNSGGTFEFPDGKTLVINSAGWRNPRAELRDYVPNFALLRREIFRSVRWEGGIGAEHYDFFLQLQKTHWKVAHDQSVIIEHFPLTEALSGYESYRFDCGAAQQWLLRKWNLEQIVHDGVVVVERNSAAVEHSGTKSTPMSRPEKDLFYFDFPRPEVVALIPTSAHNVLDIGCGAGKLGQSLKQRQAVHVTGLELNPLAAEHARQSLDSVLELDIEDESVQFEPGRFDCVVCADVLEHLREPGRVLEKIRTWLATNGVLVISLPNVRHHSVVSGLLEGNWTYEPAGLLDNDHVRFFTRREIEKLLFRSGFQITSFVPKPGSGHEEWVASGRPGRVSVGPLQIEGLSPQDAEEFFTYQYLVVARSAQSARKSTATSWLSQDAIQLLRSKLPWPPLKPNISLPQENLGWCSDSVKAMLREELAHSPGLIVELGTWLGLSTRFICDEAPSAHVICVDHWNGSPEHHRRGDWSAMLPTLFETFQALSWDYRNSVTPLRMTTSDGLREVASLGLKPDLIFVDADHSYEAVLSDLELSHQWVRSTLYRNCLLFFEVFNR